MFLTDESPVDKTNLNWKKKSKIKCLWTQLNFIQGLIKFMKCLIARNFDF
jgi:hypothetical protein